MRAGTELIVMSHPACADPSTGVEAALAPALRSTRGVWLGSSEHDVELPAQVRRDFDQFCQRSLRFVLHGLLSRAQHHDHEWEAYVAANRAFAQRAAELARPRGIVWVHDAHLLLTARVLRSLGHRGPIGLFLPTPFPSLDAFETLPWASDLVDALTRFDVIGVQSERAAANLRAAIDALGTRSAPRIVVAPMGIEPASHAAEAVETDEVRRLRASLLGRRLLLGVDRLELTSGICERLLAFERMLERHPALLRQVVLVQLCLPPPAELPEADELRSRIELLVGRINGAYGDTDWAPIRYLCRSCEPDVIAQLHRLADVALVTPLCDGGSLAAKAFVAAQPVTAPGVLVLSRFAGAAAELTEAVLTNPYHVDGFAQDIAAALAVSAPERQRRHARLYARIASSQLPWSMHFLDELASTYRAVA